jgi:hypothetical protein
MNSKNLKALGLKPDANQDEIDAAVAGVLALVTTSQEINEAQKKINRRVADSVGALDHARAATVDQHQAAFDKSPVGKMLAKNAARSKK